MTNTFYALLQVNNGILISLYDHVQVPARYEVSQSVIQVQQW
jgi:hypothetical protein